MAIKGYRRRELKSVGLALVVGLLTVGAYRLADSCVSDWSPSFFIPYSPAEKSLVAQMTMLKVVDPRGEREALDEADDSYVTIYYETYWQDFNPVIRAEISESYQLISSGQAKAALVKDRAMRTRLRNYLQLNNVRSKRLWIFLNTTEERILLVQQNLPPALTRTLLALLQAIDNAPYEEALQKITSLAGTVPKSQKFYTQWYAFLLKRLYGKPVEDADYPPRSTVPRGYKDRVAYALAKADLRRGRGAQRLAALRALSAGNSSYKNDARLELARYYFDTGQAGKAFKEIRPLVAVKTRPSFRAQELLAEWILSDTKDYPNVQVAALVRKISELSQVYQKEREAGPRDRPIISEAEVYKKADNLARALGADGPYWLPIIHYYRGVGAYISGNYADAVRIFREMIAEHPLHFFTPRSYYYLFHCYHNLMRQNWKVDAHREFDRHLLTFAKTYPDHTLLDDSINLFLHDHGVRPHQETLQRFFAGWNEADNLNELLHKLYAGDGAKLSGDDARTLRAYRCYDRYLYVSRQWPALLKEFPESRFSPLAYIKYTHHTPDNTPTDVLLTYADYVKTNASKFHPGLVKIIEEDYVRSQFLAGRYETLIKINPAKGSEYWYSALSSLKAGDGGRAVSLIKRLADMNLEPYYQEQARGFLIDRYFKTEPLTSMYYFTRFLESQATPRPESTERFYFPKYTGLYTGYALGDFQETYLSEGDIESFLSQHPGSESAPEIRRSLAVRYLRQFKFDAAWRTAQPLNNEELNKKIKDVQAHYSVDSDEGLYATGAWFYRAPDAIFSSNTTSYKYETAKTLRDLQNGYLGQLNKFLIARRMFETLIQKYPRSKLIDKAHYSLALCDLYLWSNHSFYRSFEQELFADAKKHFLEVYRKAPKSTLADDALYWAAYFSELDSERQQYWDLIRKEYPNGNIVGKGIPWPEHRDRRK